MINTIIDKGRAISTLGNGQADPMLPHTAFIERIRAEAPGVTTYDVAFVDSKRQQEYRFLPGQFNMLSLPGIGEAAISMSSDPEKPGPFQHTIRKAGNVTSAIERLKVGDTLGVRGPYGSAWPMSEAAGRDLIIVSGGIGLAPLRPAIYHAIGHRDDYGQVTILTGSRAPSELLYPDEYDSWREHDIDVIVTVDRADEDWRGHVGVVPMLFYKLRPDPQHTVVLTCGPEIMMRFVVYEALARRIPKERIFVSLERNMKCAIGLCGHCQYGPMFLCKEGPVLRYDRIEPFFSVEDF
ncbi:MAG TPA: FAD/NAD(P)-binding protein [Candidatus Sulfomarinibacteraceae bacterium]|nr:FAD/NAD(P)-binding protein [Candidatus Sulfomarinibacteraceae bacterium]